MDLSREEEKLKQQIIEDNLPLAKQLAGRFRNSGYGYDDLVSEAHVALVEAAPIAVQMVKDGNYGAFFNNAIRWHLSKLVKRMKKTVNLDPEFYSANDYTNPVLDKPAGPTCSPHTRICYSEALEQLELSELEIKVLQYKLIGYTHQEIADRLRLYKVAVTRILQKIGDRYRAR